MLFISQTVIPFVLPYSDLQQEEEEQEGERLRILKGLGQVTTDSGEQACEFSYEGDSVKCGFIME